MMLQGRGGEQLHKKLYQALWQPQEGRHGAAGQGSKGQQHVSLGQRQQHKVIGTICRSVAMKKLHRILSDTQHPLNHVLSPRAFRRTPPPPPPKKQQQQQHMRCFRTCWTSRFRNSSLLAAVRLYNSSM